VRPSTKAYYKRRLAYLTGNRLTDISPRDLNRILDTLALAPKAQAVRVYSAFFHWCVRRYYLDTSPCSRIQAPREQSRSRVLSDDELSAIWHAAKEYGLYGCIIRMLILTGMRKSEVTHLRAEYVHDGICTLPPELTKQKRPHSFPLPGGALSLLSASGFAQANSTR